jgi:hypothetical protein
LKAPTLFWSLEPPGAAPSNELQFELAPVVAEQLPVLPGEVVHVAPDPACTEHC